MHYPPTPIVSFSNRHKEIVQYIHKLMQSFNDPSHDFCHIVRVDQAAKQILQGEELSDDKEICDFVSLLCLLHDVFDEKFHCDKSNQKEQEISNLLKNAKYKKEEIPRIINAAKEISWSKFRKRSKAEIPPTITDHDHLGKILQICWIVVSNADWYDAQLVIRAYDFTKKNCPQLGENGIKVQVKNHWKEKLSQLHKYAFTNTSKEMMEKRFEEQKILLLHWFIEK